MKSDFNDETIKEEVFYMGELALKNYIKDFNKYVAEAKKTETKEESREALIRTGVLDKKGNVKKEFKNIVR